MQDQDQNTLGFRIIQGHGAEDLPPEMKAEMHKIMQHLGAVDPDDIESIVVVARVKAVGPNGAPGFGMPAVMAAVLGAVGEGEESSQGCGDPSCPNCGGQPATTH